MDKEARLKSRSQSHPEKEENESEVINSKKTQHRTYGPVHTKCKSIKTSGNHYPT